MFFAELGKQLKARKLILVFKQIYAVKHLETLFSKLMLIRKLLREHKYTLIYIFLDRFFLCVYNLIKWKDLITFLIQI